MKLSPVLFLSIFSLLCLSTFEQASQASSKAKKPALNEDTSFCASCFGYATTPVPQIIPPHLPTGPVPASAAHSVPLGRVALLHPTSAQYSQGLGLMNFNASTCFANATLKLMTVHPGILAFGQRTLLARPQIGNPQQDLKVSFHKLMRKYAESKLGLEANYGQANYPQISSEKKGFKKYLNQFFDYYESYLKATNLDGDRHFLVDSGEVKQYFRRDQMDAGEFQTHLLSVLGYMDFYGGFKFGAMTHFDSGTQTQYLQPKPDFKLELPVSNPKIKNIAGALANYFAEERMDDPRNLPRNSLGVGEMARKRTVLLARENNLPNHILLGLKRYEMKYVTNPRTGQIQARIDRIGRKIEISPTITLLFNDEELFRNGVPLIHKREMKPIAVIVHRGVSPQSGHYYTYTYDREQKAWFKHNDQDVSRLEGKALIIAQTDMEENGYQVLYAGDGN